MPGIDGGDRPCPAAPSRNDPLRRHSLLFGRDCFSSLAI